MDKQEPKATVNRTLAYQFQKDAKASERREKEQLKLARKAKQSRWANKKS